jgi:hypothetical protein
LEGYGEPEQTHPRRFRHPHNFTFSGKLIKAGKYALYSIPNKNEWTLILSTDTGLWGTHTKTSTLQENLPMTQQRLPIMKLHAWLAGFFLPIGVMFFVTGALYTWGTKGSYETTTETLALESPLKKEDLTGLHGLVVAQLGQQDLAHPSGGFKVKSAGTSFYFEWTGSNRDVVLSPTANPLEAKLQIKNTTLHRRLVQLHKAKGGKLFKIMAAALTIGLLLLFASGLRLAWAQVQVKKAAIVGLALGSLVFVLAVALS